MSSDQTQHGPVGSGEGTPVERDLPVVVELIGVGKRYAMAKRTGGVGALADALLGRDAHEGSAGFWALRDVTLRVRAGEAIGILGRNGSGKSTLLQILAGTLAPSTGSVRVAGRVAALLELGSGFNPEFSGRENVYLNGAILGLSRREVDDAFDGIAGFADIGAFLDQPVKTYSSGMLVRLAFAVQVQLRPDVLIVDEALAVGDSLFQKRCYQRIEELRQRGVTLLFVSHDQEAVRTLTDRAVLLEQGTIASEGGSARVLLDYRRLLHEQERAWFAAQASGSQREAKPTTRDADDAASRLSGMAKDLSFGDLDASVERVRVLNEAGEEATAFYPGERITVEVTARAHRDVAHLNVIFRLRSKQGLKVTSWGLLNDDIARSGRGEMAPGEAYWERVTRAGSTVVARFTFACRLGTNLYEVQAGVTQEMDRSYRAQRMLHWLDEAAFFQVGQRVDEYNFGGAFDLMPETTCEILAGGTVRHAQEAHAP